MDDQKPKRSSQREVTSLEELRRAPTEMAWRVEIERILDGYRDVSIYHQGDAADYIEDLIELSEDPALSRIAFQDALERQVALWKPGRGDGSMLDLLRHFTPAAGITRLIEMFGLPGAFAGDPAPEEPKFRGRDLRLQAFHALERYFPAAPSPLETELAGKVGPARHGAFSSYLHILKEHRRYPRYQYYVETILSRLETRETGRSEIEVEDTLIAPAKIRKKFERALLDGPQAERAFRQEIEALNGTFIYCHEGPVIQFPGYSEIEPIRIHVPPALYPRYFQIFMQKHYLLDAESLDTRHTPQASDDSLDELLALTYTGERFTVDLLLLDEEAKFVDESTNKIYDVAYAFPPENIAVRDAADELEHLLNMPTVKKQNIETFLGFHSQLILSYYLDELFFLTTTKLVLRTNAAPLLHPHDRVTLRKRLGVSTPKSSQRKIVEPTEYAEELRKATEKFRRNSEIVAKKDSQILIDKFYGLGHSQLSYRLTLGRVGNKAPQEKLAKKKAKKKLHSYPELQQRMQMQVESRLQRIF